METISLNLYKFNELDEEAKAKAVKWFLEQDCLTQDNWHEATYQDATQVGTLLGIEIDKIYFSGFYSQGDGACFEGVYRNTNKQAYEAVLEYAPLDLVLHSIAMDLDELNQAYKDHHIEAVIKHTGRYYNEHSVNIDCTINNEDLQITEIENQLIYCLRKFMKWIYSQLEKEYEHLTSEESAKEILKYSGWSFLKKW